METNTRLVIRSPASADLYLPKEEWRALVTELKSNRLTVVLRIEGVG